MSRILIHSLTLTHVMDSIFTNAGKNTQDTVIHVLIPVCDVTSEWWLALKSTIIHYIIYQDMAWKCHICVHINTFLCVKDYNHDSSQQELNRAHTPHAESEGNSISALAVHVQLKVTTSVATLL